MNLKEAIREAVDARDKLEPSPEIPKEAPPQTNSERVQASSKAVKQADTPDAETAAMTVRVSRRHRLHWLIAAKKEGTSLTAAVTEALNARFGEPSD